MDWRVLLGCISLWAGLVLAEVGSFDECKQYFCKEFQPFGFQISHWAQICQRYNRQYHFATLYDKANRIPYWSAYILSVANCPDQTSRKRQWFVEPQVSPSTENESTLSEKELRFSQAINEDYEDTSYTRGHLNPYSFQCDDSSTATFTLTNAVPMEPYFNQVRWHKLEKNLKRQLIENCISKRGTAYLVTGAVPSDNEKIPKTDEDKVSVPSHIWTAVSCDHPDNNRKFSFAFLAENKAASRLQLMSVEQLNSELSRLYSRTIKIFSNDLPKEFRSTSFNGSGAPKSPRWFETELDKFMKEMIRWDRLIWQLTDLKLLVLVTNIPLICDGMGFDLVQKII
uniref:Endonuclease domain-containing 1 protein n=1 Tax=Pelusios castaneus TaxID=367368 RepID=A0A8C8S1Y9_9SAUR